MTAAPRLSLPLLSAGMAQKEVFHNEALQLLDAIVAGVIEEGPRNSPIVSPTVGGSYIVGPAPTGDWAGHAGALATYTAGGWRLQAPVEGMRVMVRTSGVDAVYRGGAWELGKVVAETLAIGGEQVIGPRGSAIASPTGGAVVDAEARTAIAAILAAMRGHGLIES